MTVPLDDDVRKPHGNLGGAHPLHVWMAWALWREFNEYRYITGLKGPESLLENEEFVALYQKNRVTDWDDYGT
jgi:hypothetical protein